MRHPEPHRTQRIGWLRASILGANDGLVSTSSLVIGIAAAEAVRDDVLLAGLAGLVAGAMSMAAGEFVSVSSQADAEAADLERERKELDETPEAELDELTSIYVARGLEPELARKVAIQLTDYDALATHAREELGITEELSARPVQAALASAAAFAVGAALPLFSFALAPSSFSIPVVAGTSLLSLGLLGAAGAYVGGSRTLRAAVRVTLWGALAMLATAGIGALSGSIL